MTHLEAATLNAQNFASGLAALQQFEEMLAKSDAIRPFDEAPSAVSKSAFRVSLFLSMKPADM